MGLSNLFVIFLSVGIINSIISAVGIKGFLSSHNTIDSRQTLEGFKVLARRQMYQTLLQMFFLIGGNIIGFLGLIRGETRLPLIIVLNVIIIIISKPFKGNEEKARDMEVGEAGLKQEYEDVCDSWTKKAFPDF